MADSGKPSRNPERTRARILDAALEEFSNRTLDGARVDAIADRAGVNKRMLYHYFGNKEGLFAAAMDLAFTRLRPKVVWPDELADDPREAIGQMVEALFGYFDSDPRMTILINCANLHGGRHVLESHGLRGSMDQRIKHMADILERGRKTGLFRSGVDPTMMVLTMTTLIFYFFANNATVSVFIDEDLSTPAAKTAWRNHVTDFLFRIARSLPDPMRPEAGTDVPDRFPEC